MTEILSAQAPRFSHALAMGLALSVRFRIEASAGSFGVHRLVKEIKGTRSHELRRDFALLKRRLLTLWTNSYFVCTVGGAPLAIVKQYIENQKHV